MTFANPIPALIAAGIVIPTLIILYFLKLRRRDVEISSTLLWKKTIQDLQANAPFQKLRNNILLMLQLLALIVALLAIAQPEMRHRAISNARQIIMIDRSASMSAVDGELAKAADATASPNADPAKGFTRLEAAKKAALKLVENLKEPTLFDDKAEEAMVIAFDNSAVVLKSFTSSKAELRQAIESIQPTDAPSGLERAFDLARAYAGTKKFDEQVREGTDAQPGGFIPSGPTAAMHIFSDGRLPDAQKIQTVKDQDLVVFHSIGGETAPNIGVTSLSASRAFDNPGRVNIFVGLQNTDTVARTVDLELVVDGAISSAKDVRIAAATRPVGMTATRGTNDPNNDTGKPTDAAESAALVPGIGGVVFPLDRPQAGAASVRIIPNGADVLETDNIAYLNIPPAKRLSVVMVSSGNLFLRTALEGLNLSKLDVKTPAQFQEMLDAGQTAQYDVFVFDRNLPEVKGGASGRVPGIPPGRSLVLGAVPPPPLGVIDEGPGEAGIIIDFVRDHPALRLASLDKINITRSRKVKIAPETPVKSIARLQSGGGSPAILEVGDANALALVVPWDVADSDWPFDPGWVLFVAGSVAYLSETQSGALAEGMQVGQTLSTRLPAGAKDVTIRPPDASAVNLEPAPDGTVSYGPIAKTGFYTVRWSGQATATDVADGSSALRRVAANLLDASESDTGATKRLVMASEDVTAQTERETDQTRKLWPYLLLGCLAVVMFEWFIYNRKVAI